MGNLREVGRVGLKALCYFEVLSGIALVLGMVGANLLTPGSGIDSAPRRFIPFLKP
jgi:Na+/H+-dicarboxylate symporter